MVAKTSAWALSGLMHGYMIALAIGAFGAVLAVPSAVADCTVNNGSCVNGTCSVNDGNCDGGNCAVNAAGSCNSSGRCTVNAGTCTNGAACTVNGPNGTCKDLCVDDPATLEDCLAQQESSTAPH